MNKFFKMGSACDKEAESGWENGRLAREERITKELDLDASWTSVWILCSLLSTPLVSKLLSAPCFPLPRTPATWVYILKTLA
jgi:hypothetical protein